MSKKEKKPKKILTPEEKKALAKKRGKTAGVTILVIVIAFGALMGVFSIINVVDFETLMETAKSFDKVDYDGVQLSPTKDADDGYWTFTTDNDLKILQFTDIHIGAGFGSFKRDGWALNAVAAMITAEKPDLVVITGDLAYPVPFQAGTFNNLNAAKVISTLMETLGVYWTFTFGNHDTESYSMYDRADICEFYADKLRSGEYNYCLFQTGHNENLDGYGNSIIKVKNSAGKYTQALVTIDSHAYLPGDSSGIAWQYDNIHQNQIDWFANEMIRLNALNGDESLKALAFFHIPLGETKNAYNDILTYGLKPGETITVGEGADAYDVTYHEGIIGEKDNGIYSGVGDDNFFEIGLEHGLQGVFTGHDHKNNLSVTYKGIRLTYGMSIDYLAYLSIYKEGEQRGCTVITVAPDGSFDVQHENYYQQKYANTKYPKESVKM